MKLLPALLVCVTLAATDGSAAPYLPADDSQVLERLPARIADPGQRELSAWRKQLADQPANLPLALRVARRYSELGRVSGDPRYAGYAQAALGPWWDRPDAPPEVRVLRATLRQRLHQFEAALVDLDAVLKADPRNAQARLTKATILQVQGKYAAAGDECLALQPLVQDAVSAMCRASVGGLTGRLRASYGQLRSAYERSGKTDAGIRAWLATALGEMAARAGMTAAAEADFRTALAIDPADSYLLGAYADFLLDTDRAREVPPLLKAHLGVDALLLRHALALQAIRSPDLGPAVDQLRARFDASRLRGERVHLREEARFTLHLLGNAAEALRLAEQNWAIQKEPADLRLLLQAAVAAHDETAQRAARRWVTVTGLEDVQLLPLLGPASGAVKPE
ncbi:MAG: hypothetical protein WBP72_08645 [Rhodocyclaceae bacterium]